jgi:hypothetical protein
LAIALALLAACAFNGATVLLADRSRVVVESAMLAIAAVVFFAFSVPAAQLTYGEAISQVLPGGHPAAIIAVEGRLSGDGRAGDPGSTG